MNKTIRLNQNALAFGIPLTIMLAMVLLANSSWFKLYPEALSMGITFDLVLTVPLIYLLLIRKLKIPKATAVPFFITGIIIAGLIIPEGHQFYLTLAKSWILPVVEMIIIFMLVFKVRKAVKLYKTQREVMLDFYTAVRETAADMLPKRLSPLVATEITTIYYGFFQWKKRKLSGNEFSYHKNTGTVALLFTFMLLIPVEIFIVHLLIALWSDTVAWILSILSLYSALQILGIARSMGKRPIAIQPGKLILRYGILNDSSISFEDIVSIELSSKPIHPDQQTRYLSPFGDFEGHNVIINLKSENTLHGLWGFKKTYKRIALHVDEKEKFVRNVNNILQ